MRRRHVHRCAERTNTTILKTHGVVRAEIVRVPSVLKIFELRMLAVTIGDKRTYICIQSPAQTGIVGALIFVLYFYVS